MSSQNILAVDLDGTLLKTDTLYETFWSALRLNWMTFFICIPLLIRGKIFLKEYLFHHCDLKIDNLPFNEEVIKYVTKFRENGGKTVLITASYFKIAEKIADHLNIFDEVYGTNKEYNLKGKLKVDLLNNKYGANNYSYIGNGNDDLNVWKDAKNIITVGASNSLLKKLSIFDKPKEHLNSNQGSLSSCIAVLRPYQWIKNTLIFLPMMLAAEIYFETFIQSLMAFAAFSLLASAVYVLNDLIDLESDRSHPRKKNRPIASGSVSFTYAHLVIILLIGLSTVPSILLGKYFCIILMTYFFLTALYSCYIKRLIAIDVCILACLYTIRIIGGGAATNIDVSVWLLAFSIFLFLSLAAIKRQGELVDLSNRGLKKVEGRGYEVGDLTIINILSLCAGYLSVLIMALYLDTLEASMLFAKPSMLWGLCVVHLYWITRLVLITNRGQMDDDPIIFALKDNISKFCVFACLIFIVLAIN